MQYIITVLLVLMTITFITCGILLWRRRAETGDYSRTIQALFSWVSAFFTFTFIFRTGRGRHLPMPLSLSPSTPLCPCSVR